MSTPQLNAKATTASDPNAPAGVRIGYAVVEQLPAIKALADRAKDGLGFVHRGALARAIDRDEVVVAIRDEVVGFCHFYRRQDGVATIYHLAVAPGCRRSGIGRCLVEHVIADAREHGVVLVRLKCPADLEANAFYAQLSFRQAGVEDRLPRALVLWEHVLAAGQATGDFAGPDSDTPGSSVG
jgi:N-acetylglutamate synthase-like GNAT family acetyltransferase